MSSFAKTMADQRTEERLILARYRVMRPDKPDETGEIMWPREPGYAAIKALIEPLLEGRLEHVSVLADFEGGTNYNRADMFVDEDGGQKGLLVNDAATVIYRRATMMGRTGQPIPMDPEDLPAIVGPAVLFSRRIWF